MLAFPLVGKSSEAMGVAQKLIAANCKKDREFLRNYYLRNYEISGKHYKKNDLEEKISSLLKEDSLDRFCKIKIVGEKNDSAFQGIVVREDPNNPYFKALWKFTKVGDNLILSDADTEMFAYPNFDFYDLKMEYESNGIRAVELQGKVIGVSGTVWKVDRDKSGKAFVAFSGFDETRDIRNIVFLKCSLLPEALDVAKTLNKGQQVKLTGKLIGKEFVKIELKECAVTPVRWEIANDKN